MFKIEILSMKSWYKIAINQWTADEVEKDYRARFKHLFGDKKRIVIPLMNKWLANVKHLLETGKTKTGTKYIISSNFEFVYSNKVKRDGTQDARQFNTGKIINSELGPEYMNEWARQYEIIKKYGTTKNEIDYSIILSIDPVDIARMSDFDGIESCHSPDEQYFRDAKDEAKAGGAIAYVVKNEKLKQLSQEEIDNGDIFFDAERSRGANERGIVPISRLRINKYVNEYDKNIEVAIPTNNVYGIPMNGFYNAVKEYLLDTQKELIENNCTDMTDFQREGGTYADSNDKKIIKEFLGHDAGVTNNLVNKSMGEEMLEQWQTEVSDHTEKFNKRGLPITVYGNVNDDDESLSIYWGISVDLDFYGFYLNEEQKINAMNLIEKDTYNDQSAIKLLRNLASDENGYGDFDDIEIENIENNSILVTIKIFGNTIFNPDDYGNAIDETRDTWNSTHGLLYKRIHELLLEATHAMSGKVATEESDFVKNLTNDEEGIVVFESTSIAWRDLYNIRSAEQQIIFTMFENCWIDVMNSSRNDNQLEFNMNIETKPFLEHNNGFVPRFKMGFGVGGNLYTINEIKNNIFNVTYHPNKTITIRVAIDHSEYYSFGKEYFSFAEKNINNIKSRFAEKLVRYFGILLGNIRKKVTDRYENKLDIKVQPSVEEKNTQQSQQSQQPQPTDSSRVAPFSNNPIQLSKNWYDIFKSGDKLKCPNKQ